MSQRHVNDTLPVPWEGAADRQSARYCPPELREIAADIPADVERAIERELFSVREMIVTDGFRAKHTLNPGSEPADLADALCLKKVEWAGRQLASQRHDADRAAYDNAHYRCGVCAEVRVPGIGDRHARRRTFPDGTIANVCGTCAPVLERLAVDRLAAEKLDDGRTRNEAAIAVLERTVP